MYRAFHERLWNVFYEKEWKRLNPERRLKTYAPALWTLKESITYVARTKILYNTRHKDERIFDRRYQEAKKGAMCKLDPLLVCNALEYMGFQVEQYLPGREHLQVKTRELIKSFLAETLPDYRLDEEKLEDMFCMLVKNGGQAEKPAAHDVIKLTMTTQLDNQEAVKALISNFYENVGVGRYADAWQLMTADFQNRTPWNGNVDRFIEGYYNAVGLNSLTIFDLIQKLPSVVDAQVCFNDEIAAYTSADLAALSSMTVADTEKFVQCIGAIREKVQQAGGQGFDNIELYKLFESGASEYIWYRCGIPTANIEMAFPTQRTIVIKRLYNCSCKLFEGKWQINSIRGIPVQSVR